jgi:adenylate cyclase
MAPSTEPQPASVSGEAARPAQAAALSLRTKAAVLFCAMTLFPLTVSSLLLVDVNRRAVEESERQLQASVIAEISGRVVRRVEAARVDAEAVAAALGEAAEHPSTEGDGLSAVRAIVATRPTLQAARFEVPEAKVSTVIQQQGQVAGPPPSTEAQRRVADERGVSFSVAGPAVGTLVVPIRKQPGGRGKQGYVTTTVDLADVAVDLEQVTELRYAGEGFRAAMFDGDRRVVAAHGAAGLAPGVEGRGLPVLASMPDGAPWSTPVGIVTEHTEGGEAMVGAVQTVPQLGWAVAMWRPRAIAFKALTEMRRRGLAITLGGTLLSLFVGLLASRAVTRPILELVEQARLIGERRWRQVRVASGRGDEIGQLEQALGQMAQGLERGEAEIADQARLRGDLGRFLSKDLVDAIVRGEHPLALGGKRAPISVLFADVVAFTPLAERLPPEQVVALLNELFSVLSEVVFRHHGTVDKFIGDCLMAVWGAPVAHDDHAALALAAAEDMVRFLEAANARFEQAYGVEIRLGIGVNSGEALVGNIGSDKRMEYTVIGDVVNVAARLEAIAAPGQVLVSAATRALAGDAFELRLLGERRLTGRKESTEVYELETGLAVFPFGNTSRRWI